MTLRFFYRFRDARLRRLPGTTAGRIVFWSLAILMTAIFTARTAAAEEPTKITPPAAAAAGAPHEEDERAIRAQTANYAKAFAKADVEALAAMWAEDAEYTDEVGTIFRGREAIRAQIAAFFKLCGKQPLEISVRSIQFPSETTAIEHGVTTLTSLPAPLNAQSYTAVHVKRDGAWQMVSVAESPYEPPLGGLKDLGWLIGNWNVQGPAADLHMKSEWIAGGKGIRMTVDTDEKDGTKTSHTEYIFWNPRRNQLSSWQLDGSGGSGTGWWEKAGEDWIRHTVSVEPDGRLARANYVLHPVDANTFSWQSTGRRVSGRPLPDTAKILVKREGV